MEFHKNIQTILSSLGFRKLNLIKKRNMPHNRGLILWMDSKQKTIRPYFRIEFEPIWSRDQLRRQIKVDVFERGSRKTPYWFHVKSDVYTF